MNILTSNKWTEYKLLDSGGGMRLEKFGPYILVRPDPQALWKQALSVKEWQKVDAKFIKESYDKGRWVKINKTMPSEWTIRYGKLVFKVKLSTFKHTGVFSEQAVHWEWIKDKVTKATKVTEVEKGAGQGVRVLNLFGYTGVATLVAAEAGAVVTHVDASYPAIGWARENQKVSGLLKKPIRWILDDCLKFCQRELKRGVKYHGVIMDPPIYGHGPKGEKWDFDKSFPELMEVVAKILVDKPLFVIVNAYAISASSLMLKNVLEDYLDKFDGKIEFGELGIEEENFKKRILSTGIFARWSKD